MSSRQTKSTRKSTTTTARKTTATTPTTPVTSTRSNAAVGAAPVVVQDPDAPYSWTHDYDYVKKDLTKLAAVSATLFIIIIVAGFFIR